jgi:hypothetical protein
MITLHYFRNLMAISPLCLVPATPLAVRIAAALHASGLTLTQKNIAAINQALGVSEATQSSGDTPAAAASKQFCDGFTESLIAAVSNPAASGTDGYALAWDDSLRKHVCVVGVPDEANEYSGKLPHPVDVAYQHTDARELGCIVGIAVMKSVEMRPFLLDRFADVSIERDRVGADDHVVGFPAIDSAGNALACPFCACQAAYDCAARADGREPVGLITQMRQFGHVILFQIDADVDALYALNVSEGTLLPARFVAGLFSDPGRELIVGDSVWIVDGLVKWASPEDIKAFGNYPVDGDISGLVRGTDGTFDALLVGITEQTYRIPVAGLVRKTNKATPPVAKHLH